MELMQLSDRILVLQAGRPAALLEPDQFSQERLLDHAMPGGAIEPRFQNEGERGA
jgi:ABC-type sugar transport system ATPase subunit